jgi:hypothetical protein
MLRCNLYTMVQVRVGWRRWRMIALVVLSFGLRSYFEHLSAVLAKRSSSGLLKHPLSLEGRSYHLIFSLPQLTLHSTFSMSSPTQPNPVLLWTYLPCRYPSFLSSAYALLLLSNRCFLAYFSTWLFPFPLSNTPTGSRPDTRAGTNFQISQ